MKLPSIHLLVTSFLQVIRRFPLVLLAALIGVITSIYLVHLNPSNTAEWILFKVFILSSLGLPLFFALHIFFEKNQANLLTKFIGFAIGIGLLLQLYFALGYHSNPKPEVYYRLFFWSAGLHLVAAFSAFFVYQEINGFWQFNKVLFLRFLTAALYSGVLYLGLAGAILAVETLFNFDFNSDLYVDLWIFIAGIFNTVFFLGGIPQPLAQLNTETDYPKGLKIFTQYVLLPLVAIYLLILYAYLGKIIIAFSLPKGWVANLIFGFSVSGIFSLLLVYPIRNLEENTWIKTFSRWYYYSLVPLIVLLFVAIGYRVNEYGVTIERYIVAMLGIWLAVITLYFIFSKQKNIVLIPLTLCLFLFGSLVGPWGMFKLSEHSQLNKLHYLLQKNGAFVNGKIKKLSPEAVAKIKIKDINQINSITDYLERNHSLDGAKVWFDKDCEFVTYKDITSRNYYSAQSKMQECLGLYGDSYRYDNTETDMESYLSCNEFDTYNGVDITGYNELYNLVHSDIGESDIESKKQNQTDFFLKDNTVSIYRYGKQAYSVSLKPFANGLKAIVTSNNQHNIVSEKMTYVTATSTGDTLKFMFRNMNVKVTDTSSKITSLNGYLFIKHANPK